MHDIIDTPEKEQKPLNLASTGARFGNYLIDIISFYVMIFIVSFVAGDFVIDTSEDMLGIFILIFYIMFYTVFEHLTGKTPGKFLTRTNVVKADGSRPSFVNLLGRNTARFIPLDAFSFLFSQRGWHDSVSGTYVVYDEGRT